MDANSTLCDDKELHEQQLIKQEPDDQELGSQDLDGDQEAGVVNPALGPNAQPEVKVLVGEDESPFLVPMLCLFRLSKQFAHHVLVELPRRDHMILAHDIDSATFKRLGEFQLTGRYAGPDMNPVVNPKETAGAAEGDEGDVLQRHIFTTYTAGVERMIQGIQHLSQSEIFGETVPERALDFLGRLGGHVTEGNHPLAVNSEVLLAHARVYVLAVRHHMEYLELFALAMLLRAILHGHMTYDFIGDFADTAAYILRETGRDTIINDALTKIGALTSFYFMTHPKFVKLMDEFGGFREAVLDPEVYGCLAARLS